MITWWTIVRFVHIVGAIVWVGGQLTLTLVVAPMARRDLDDATRARLMEAVGRRYAAVAVAGVLPLQLATGLALTFHQGVTLDSFADRDWGLLLGIKLVAVVVAVVLAAVHGVLSARARPGLARVAGLSGLTTSVVVVLLATALAT